MYGVKTRQWQRHLETDGKREFYYFSTFSFFSMLSSLIYSFPQDALYIFLVLPFLQATCEKNLSSFSVVLLHITVLLSDVLLNSFLISPVG